MVPGDRATCPACAGPTPAPALCAECHEAFTVACRASATVVADDLDLWDAWSVLGDVGGRPAVSGR